VLEVANRLRLYMWEGLDPGWPDMLVDEGDITDQAESGEPLYAIKYICGRGNAIAQHKSLVLCPCLKSGRREQPCSLATYVLNTLHLLQALSLIRK
jgi:hypothetical protein